ENLEEAADPAGRSGTEARADGEHDDDAESEQRCGPERDPADHGRRDDQRSEDERTRSSDGSGDASRAPEPVVSGKRAREQSEPHRSAEMRRREGVDE